MALEGIGNNGRFQGFGSEAQAITARGGKPAAPDLSATMIRELLGLYNNNGTYQAGSAPRLISHARERANAQTGFRQAEADRSKVYGEAVAQVKARNPDILAGYSKASADLQANARARKLADAEAGAARDQDMLRAAAAMGLTMAPPTKTRADEVAAEGQNQVQLNADAWQGFNSNTAQRAVERNDAVGDAFTWQGAQQQAALQKMLQQTLSSLVDTYTGGSAGRMVGGTSTAQKIGIAKTLLGFSNTDFDNDLAARQATTPTTRITTDKNGNTSTSVTSRG